MNEAAFNSVLLHEAPYLIKVRVDTFNVRMIWELGELFPFFVRLETNRGSMKPPFQFTIMILLQCENDFLYTYSHVQSNC